VTEFENEFLQLRPGRDRLDVELFNKDVFLLREVTTNQAKLWRVLTAAAVPLTPSFRYGVCLHNRNVIQGSWRGIVLLIDICGSVVRSSEYEKWSECNLKRRCDSLHNMSLFD
jgi:hypothetical protein